MKPSATRITLTTCKRAIKLYNNPQASKATNRHNQRAWLASIATLGSKWILASQVLPISKLVTRKGA